MQTTKSSASRRRRAGETPWRLAVAVVTNASGMVLMAMPSASNSPVIKVNVAPIPMTTPSINISTRMPT
ncbi:MAG: hypothetical protein H6644_17270 [Caldilineaceae bacterium]|nr:hypothetical protein [Caldilineaceae bacterium]